MEVIIENLEKQFGNVPAVEKLNLDIKDGEFVAFLGPSGCGKTTTLLMLAGIYRPSGGKIKFGGRVVNQMPPRDRNIGMVFQSYALYPHMTVYNNIAYPLKLKNFPKAIQDEQVRRIANTMGIGDLLDRRPGQLSGGQQQRVALGRALVKEPDILLFDEPLSNLDARLRLVMRGEIKHLQKRFGITSIYVTHDQVEALTMADRIAVMNAGKLQAFDTPEDLYNRPKTMFIAGFVGNPPMNFIEVDLIEDSGRYIAQNDALALDVPNHYGKKALQQASHVTMGIRPEDVILTNDGNIKGSVFVVEPMGRDDMLDVRIGNHSLMVLVDPKLHIRAGDLVKLKFNLENIQFFDKESGRSLLWN